MVCNIKAIAADNERAIDRHTPSHYHHEYNTLLDCGNTFAGRGVAVEYRPFRTLVRIALGRPVDDALETAYRTLCNMLHVTPQHTHQRHSNPVLQLYFGMLKLLLDSLLSFSLLNESFVFSANKTMQL